MVRTGTFAALGNALSVMASNFGIVLVLCTVAGVVGSFLSGAVADVAVERALQGVFAEHLSPGLVGGSPSVIEALRAPQGVPAELRGAVSCVERLNTELTGMRACIDTLDSSQRAAGLRLGAELTVRGGKLERLSLAAPTGPAPAAFGSCLEQKLQALRFTEGMPVLGLFGGGAPVDCTVMDYRVIVKPGMEPAVAQQTAEERVRAFYADGKAFQKAYPEMYGLSRSTTLILANSLATMLADTLWMGLFGAIVASATIYLWVQREKQRPASLYEALNYALARWKRVVGPHFRSVLLIQVGVQLLVPGVLFAMQRAFVDAIATLDDREADPVGRSKRLTAARRGLVLQTFLVAALWWVPFALAGMFLLLDPASALTPYFGAERAEQIAPFLTPAAYVVSYLVLCLVDLCMVQFYLDIFRRPAAETSPAAQPPSSTPA